MRIRPLRVNRQERFEEDARLLGEHIVRRIASEGDDARREREEHGIAMKAVVDAVNKQLGRGRRKIASLESQLNEIALVPSTLAAQIWALLFALFPTLIEFALVEFTIADFKWGLVGHGLALGVAMATPLLAHELVRHVRGRWPSILIAAVGCCAAAGALAALAELRTSQLARTQEIEGTVVFDGGEQVLPVDPTIGIEVRLSDQVVKRAMIAIELAAVLGWVGFLKKMRPTNSLLRCRLKREIRKTQKSMIKLSILLKDCVSEPGERHAARVRALRRAVMDAVEKSERWMRVGILVLSALAVENLDAADSLHLVVGLDATQTEATVGLGGKSEFEENRAAISQLIVNLPAGAHVVFVTITSASPHLILDARLDPNPGYRNSRLTEGRRRLLAEWNSRSQKSTPDFAHTDILTFLEFASQTLRSSTAPRRVILLASDMRNDRGVNLETPMTIDVKRSIDYLDGHGLIPDLSGIELYIIAAGEKGGKRTAEYNVGLRQFWTELFSRAHATLGAYSMLRDADALLRATEPATLAK